MINSKIINLLLAMGYRNLVFVPDIFGDEGVYVYSKGMYVGSIYLEHGMLRFTSVECDYIHNWVRA